MVLTMELNTLKPSKFVGIRQYIQLLIQDLIDSPFNPLMANVSVCMHHPLWFSYIYFVLYT